MLSYKNTAKELKESKTKTAILPIGSIEQHSSHLPMGTDYFVVKELSERVAERIDAYLLPPIPVSTCYEHKGTKGTTWMRPETFSRMVQDIVLSLKHGGFNKVIIMLGHGGIFIAGPCVRELNALNDDLEVIFINPPNDEKIQSVLEGDSGIHAGEKETSCVLAIDETLVNKELMMENDFVPDCPREFLNYIPLPELSKTGVWGKSSLATKEKGEKVMELAVEYCLDYIGKAFKYTKSKVW